MADPPPPKWVTLFMDGPLYSSPNDFKVFSEFFFTEKTSRQEAVGGSNHQKPMERKIQRLTASQIYCQLLSIRQEATAAEHSTGGNNLHEVTKIFRRYLERKIEADTLEDEARTMNVSLNEIEEERNKGISIQSHLITKTRI